MARTPRKQAESEIYHVVCRGVGRQDIFEDDADRTYFLSALRDELASRDGETLAWCLMNNHVHLLLRMPLNELSATMRSVGSDYALYFNRRHDRTGHLFQGRFRSEPVETDAYLLTVVGYIHRNPVAGGLSRTCDYRWSSYRAYLGLSEPVGLTSCETVLSLLGGVDAFEQLHGEAGTGERCIDVDDDRRPLRDEEATLLARSLLGGMHPREVVSLPRPRRDEALRKLLSCRISVRQIERITGVSRGIVSRVRARAAGTER